MSNLFFVGIYRIVPVTSATVGNKSKTEDTLNSNGVLADDAEESSQFSQKSVANSTSQVTNNSKPGSSVDIASVAKKTQVKLAFCFYQSVKQIYSYRKNLKSSFSTPVECSTVSRNHLSKFSSQLRFSKLFDTEFAPIIHWSFNLVGNESCNLSEQSL